MTSSLHLYRHMLQGARKFEYNFGSYVHRRVKEEFRANKGESDPEAVQRLLAKAQDNLQVIQRQGTIQSLYRNTHETNIMETKHRLDREARATR
jgi:hypothetical protein